MTTIAFIVSFVVSLIACYIACYVVYRTASYWGLVDKPGERKIHDRATPTGGGIGIWFGIVVTLALLIVAVALAQSGLFHWGEAIGLAGLVNPLEALLNKHAWGVYSLGPKLAGLLTLGTILLILGTIDDRGGLSWKIRIFVQTLVAALAVAIGFRGTFFIDAGWLSAIISVIWIVALINSFNMLDNMDGLSAGVAFICSLFLMAVALFFATNPVSGEPQLFVAGLAVILAGATAGFLIHNRPPAKIFMGDGGAYLIGFLLATLSLRTTFVGPGTNHQAVFVPLCIFAVPLYDLISVVTIRIRSGKSPFHGDTNHYSHRLVRIGLSRKQAVFVIYLTNLICCISSLFLYQVNLFFATLVLFQVVLILLLVAILEITQRNRPID